jgi:tetratricopeptide (TPR) repeat protein
MYRKWLSLLLKKRMNYLLTLLTFASVYCGALVPAHSMSEVSLKTMVSQCFNSGVPADNKIINCTRLIEYLKPTSSVGEVMGWNDRLALIQAYLSRGEVYAKKQKYQQALFDFKAVCQWADLDGHQKNREDYTEAQRQDIVFANFATYLGLTVCYSKLNDAYQTIESANKALMWCDKYAALKTNDDLISESRSTILTARSMAQRVIGHYQEALSDAVEAVNISPNYWIAKLQRGLAYYSLENYSSALTDFSEVINHSDQPVHYRNRANTYFRLRLFEQALADYRIITAHLDKFSQNERSALLVELAIIRVLVNRDEHAQDNITEALQINQNKANPHLFHQLFIYYIITNNFKEAESALKKYLKMIPKMTDSEMKEDAQFIDWFFDEITAQLSNDCRVDQKSRLKQKFGTVRYGSKKDYIAVLEELLACSQP